MALNVSAGDIMEPQHFWECYKCFCYWFLTISLCWIKVVNMFYMPWYLIPCSQVTYRNAFSIFLICKPITSNLVFYNKGPVTPRENESTFSIFSNQIKNKVYIWIRNILANFSKLTLNSTLDTWFTVICVFFFI